MIRCLPSIVTCLFKEIFSSSGGPPYPADMRKGIIYSYEIITGVQLDAWRQHREPICAVPHQSERRLERVAHRLLLIKKRSAVLCARSHQVEINWPLASLGACGAVPVSIPSSHTSRRQRVSADAFPAVC